MYIIEGKNLHLRYKTGKLEEAVRVFRRLYGDGEADRLYRVDRDGKWIDLSDNR